MLMCPGCLADRARGRGPYPDLTDDELRAGLDLLPTWVLAQKAAAFSVPTASELLSLLHGCRSADHRPCRIAISASAAVTVRRWLDSHGSRSSDRNEAARLRVDLTSRPTRSPSELSSHHKR